MRRSRNHKTLGAKIRRAMRCGNTALAHRLIGFDKAVKDCMGIVAEHIQSENPFYKFMKERVRGDR